MPNNKVNNPKDSPAIAIPLPLFFNPTLPSTIAKIEKVNLLWELQKITELTINLKLMKWIQRETHNHFFLFSAD